MWRCQAALVLTIVTKKIKIQGLIGSVTSEKWDKSVVYSITLLTNYHLFFSYKSSIEVLLLFFFFFWSS
jgi:hypothetical protein